VSSQCKLFTVFAHDPKLETVTSFERFEAANASTTISKTNNTE